MKKRILFIIMAVLTFVVVLSACGKDKNSDTNTNTGSDAPVACTHNWESQSSTASCVTAGKETFKCSLCQETKEEDAAALGHDMQFVQTVAPTCQTGGWDDYACAREGCDATEKRRETAPSYAPEAHDFQDAGEPATCTTAGYKDMLCSRCGNSAGERVPIYALGHTYERADFDGTTGVTRVEPTCEENGSITRACQECTVTETKTYEDLSGADASDADKAIAETLKATGHNFDEKEDASNVSEYVAPTCTTPGYIVHSCQNGCGETQKTVAGYEKLGHTYERNTDKTTWTYVTTLQPTCITTGTAWVVCTEEDCGYNTKDDEVTDPNYSKVVAATGEHVFDKAPVVTAPTCTDDGYTTYFCSADAGCEAYEDRDTTTKLGHDWALKASDLLDGKPFCKTQGNWNYECIREGCDVEEYNVNGDTPIVDAKHENFTQGTYAVAPTCISRGKYLCGDCGETFEAYPEDTDANATGIHTFNKKGATTASTCSVYGYTTYHCDNDGECQETERRDYTPLAAHDYTEPSEDGTITCFACGNSYRDVTTAVLETSAVLCTCGNKGTENPCTCKLKVEFIATKIPDPAYKLNAENSYTLTKEYPYTLVDENGETILDETTGEPVVKYRGPAVIVLKGAAGTEYTITVKDADGNAITTYDIIVDGNDVGDANVVTKVKGELVKVSLEEIWSDIKTITITSTTDAEVQMYFPIN